MTELGISISEYVSNIQHYCVHDGNGFRTTVFLQGCPIRCKWCQNPELQNLFPVHMWDARACIGCLACQDACSKNNLLFKAGDGFRPWDMQRCIDCQESERTSCVESCSYGARKFSSRKMTAESVLNECLKERLFWIDGGGITLSGGEPLIHKEFCHEIGKLCYQAEVDLAVETCGYVPWQNISQMLGLVNTYLYDLKLVSHSLRQKWLGVSGDQDLSNLIQLAKLGVHIVLRIPLIPGVNDTKREFELMLDFVDSLGTIENLHILPFHQLGMGKYDQAGMSYSLGNLAEATEQSIARVKSMAEDRGFCVDIGGTSFS